MNPINHDTVMSRSPYAGKPGKAARKLVESLANGASWNNIMARFIYIYILALTSTQRIYDIRQYYIYNILYIYIYNYILWVEVHASIYIYIYNLGLAIVK